MPIPHELFLLAALGTWHLIHSQRALPQSFKTEWTVSKRSKPLWLVVAVLGSDRQKRRPREIRISSMAKCLVKIQTRRSLHLHMVNHCSSNVFVRLLRHGSKVTARNAGMCHALGCHPMPGESCRLPAFCSLPATQWEAKGERSVKSFWWVMEEREGGREAETGREEGEWASAKGKWEGVFPRSMKWHKIVKKANFALYSAVS